MHSPSLWYETEARNFLMIIFLTNIEILYLECVSTNDYMLILLKGISRSLRRRGKQVREILESSILQADTGIPNTPALTKWCTGTYLTCFTRRWSCDQIQNSTRAGRTCIS